jgi:hypothetical protein
MTEKRKVVVSSSDTLAEELGAEEALVAEMVDEDSDTEDLDEVTSVEDLPDEEEIWPDGPTAGQIKLWKKEYGDVYVTSISFDKHIAWRPLSRLEYKNLVRKMEQLVQSGQLSTAEANLWNEEAIAELCILFPSYDIAAMTREMAGLPSLISQEVLEASGFVALEVRQL